LSKNAFVWSKIAAKLGIKTALAAKDAKKNF
jgi:hypothetical protein